MRRNRAAGLSSSDHPIGVRKLQTAYAAEQREARQVVDLILEWIASARWRTPCPVSCRGLNLLGPIAAGHRAGNHIAALRMVAMQGGVFGCVATSEAVLAVTTVDVTTIGDHHAG